MKVREVLRLLRDDGWYAVATRGNPGDDLAVGTLKSILVQAGLKEQ